MSTRVCQSLFLLVTLLTAGCSSTPMSDMFIHHFNQAASSEAAGKCMNDDGMFNNRQLMVAPTAVENAWNHCLNQFGIWVPGQEPAKKSSNEWGTQ